MATIPERPDTGTARVRWVVLASASSPELFTPAACTVPSASRKTEWSSPPEAATTDVRPDAGPSVVRDVVLPSDNWPWAFDPVAHTAPSVLTTSVCSVPAPIACAPVVSSHGLVTFVVVPLPIWPALFRPQM
jgi:hypothetical protein